MIFLVARRGERMIDPHPVAAAAAAAAAATAAMSSGDKRRLRGHSA